MLKNSFYARSKTRGVTLIELLVGLTIGLLLALVASSTYLFSKQTFNTVTEVSQMEENGRFALNLLTRYIQSAGFTMIDPKAQLPAGGASDKISGCDNGFTTMAVVSPNFTCLSAPGATRSAGIKTIFETDKPSGGSASFQGANCIGNNATPVIVAGVTKTYLVTSYFYVSTATAQTAYGTTTMGQLSCLSDDSPSAASPTYQIQPIVPGIQQIAANYLVTTAAAGGQLAQTAAAVTTAATWPDVSAVELCVLAKSIGPSNNDTGKTYTDCYGTAITATANETYRTFRSTVNLRNVILK